MTTRYADNPPPEIVSKRDELFGLFEKRNYDKAADMALSAAAKVNLFMPIEAIADKIRNTHPDDAVRLYEIALGNARKYAGGATSGAEGLGMSHEVRILENKVKKFRNEMKR